MQAEEKSYGQDEEMQQLCQGIFGKVIPRLLRPVEETGGRVIQLCLIHSELWAGNTSTHINSNLPVVYNGAYPYAHNESMSISLTVGDFHITV